MAVTVVWTTERGEFHQQRALEAAPAGVQVTMLREPDRATLKSALAEATYWVSERRGTIDADLLAAAPKLELIQRLGRLTYDIDTKAAEARGIAVAYQPLPGVMQVAEHVMMQMLVLSKRTRQVEAVALAASDESGERKRTTEDTFAFNWSGQGDIGRLWEATVGIVGFGAIGLELAVRLAGWGCRVLYNKRSRLPDAVEARYGLQHAGKSDIYREADYVVNLLPYSPETDMSIGVDEIAAMQSSVYFVSAGSGSVVDEAALADAVEREALGGVALDAYEYEPIAPDNPLISLAKQGHNVLLTPHTAAVARGKGANDTIKTSCGT